MGETTQREADESDQFEIPSDIRLKAKQDAKNGLEIRVSPLELIEQMDKADEALNGDSNDAEHDALFVIRQWLSEVFENGKRE